MQNRGGRVVGFSQRGGGVSRLLAFILDALSYFSDIQVEKFNYTQLEARGKTGPEIAI